MGNSSTTIILPVETENDEAAFWKLYDEIYCETSVSDDNGCIVCVSLC
jgi:hypothetical protein